jgi:hypothetical protein
MFSPDRKLYLGFVSLMVIDYLNLAPLKLKAKIAKYTHKHRQVRLRRAAAQMVSQDFCIAFNIRELTRQ